MKKQLISIVLVLCLLLPFVPSAAAYTANPAETISATALSAEEIKIDPLPAQESELVATEEKAPATTRGDNDIAYPVTGGNIYFDPETGTITDCDTSVTTADIPSEINGVAVTCIGYEAFYKCISLTTVTIPDTVTSIGTSAFLGCSGLTGVIIPNGVRNIYPWAFQSCTSLTTVTISDSVTSIGYQAFIGCTGLIAFCVDENNEYYSSDECGVLFNKDKTILIQAPGTIIEYSIPNGVEKIEADAFYKCASLASVTIPDSVRYIEVSAFGQTALYNNSGNWIDGVLYIDGWLIEASSSVSGEYVILDGTCGVAEWAFRDLNNLTSVFIPESLIAMSGEPFLNCYRLSAIWVDENNTFYSSDEHGVLFTKDKTRLVQAPCAIDTGYTVPDGVQCIDDSAFYNCTHLPYVIIPDSVISIGNSAFEGCYQLKGAVIGEGVTSIGDSAFENCSILKGLYFLGDAPEIGDNAFVRSNGWGTYDLEYLRIYYLENKEGWPLAQWDDNKTGVMELSGNCGAEDDNLTWEVSLQKATLTISGSGEMASDPWGLFFPIIGKIILPDGLINIADDAFSSFYALTDITIPNSVTSIGENAFWYCTRLTTITIPENVKNIGSGAFEDCGSLESVFFLGDAPEIGEYVFDGFNCSVDATLYYLEGKEGWTTPEWNGYPTALHVHDFSSSIVKEPTCEEEGYTTHKCSICGGSHIDSYVEALGHSWNDGETTTEATCTDDGLMTFTCATCGATETEAIPATGHDYVDGVCVNCGAEDPDYVAPTEPTEPTEPSEPSEPIEPSVTFTDVPESAWYVESVNYVVENGLMNGMGKNEFQPNIAMTRAMLVTVLWRYAGSPVEGENVFNDLTQDWYVQAVAWAAENGIVNGYPDGTFRPDDEVTREQLATIIYRYCNAIGINTSSRADLSAYPDGSKVNTYAQDAISWAVAVGLITGITHGGDATAYLEPQTSATRAQVATILMRFIENVAK